MREEVKSAVSFVCDILRKRHVDNALVDWFFQALFVTLCARYQAHWFPEKPCKGSAYRCLRIVNSKMDPILAQAAARCGLSDGQLLKYLPSELTLWVDPKEVSYRIGEDGSVGVLFQASGDGGAVTGEELASMENNLLRHHPSRPPAIVAAGAVVSRQSHFVVAPSLSSSAATTYGLHQIEHGLTETLVAARG